MTAVTIHIVAVLLTLSVAVTMVTLMRVDLAKVRIPTLYCIHMLEVAKQQICIRVSCMLHIF